jgi:hypothetical protein
MQRGRRRQNQSKYPRFEIRNPYEFAIGWYRKPDRPATVRHCLHSKGSPSPDGDLTFLSSALRLIPAIWLRGEPMKGRAHLLANKLSTASCSASTTSSTSLAVNRL